MTKGNAKRGDWPFERKAVSAKNASDGGIPIVNIRSAIFQFTVVLRDPTID